MNKNYKYYQFNILRREMAIPEVDLRHDINPFPCPDNTH